MHARTISRSWTACKHAGWVLRMQMKFHSASANTNKACLAYQAKNSQVGHAMRFRKVTPTHTYSDEEACRVMKRPCLSIFKRLWENQLYGGKFYSKRFIQRCVSRFSTNNTIYHEYIIISREVYLVWLFKTYFPRASLNYVYVSRGAR